jgi:fructoselysine-6-P-deglycase FrlB-like protein
MSFVAQEIESQPTLWGRAAALACEAAAVLPEAGARVAVFGCGTSLYMAQAIAVAREAAGHGETDAFPASEMPAERRYDLAVALSRSGTTTEVVELTRRVRASMPVLAITAQEEGPLAELATRNIAVPFADERSVVQTRFATCTVALFRAHFGEPLDPVIADGERAVAAAPAAEPDEFRQFVFLGRGASVGLAREAALKLREAARAWTEAYPAMEYRHGPISVADDETLVWALEPLPPGLARDIAATGATLVNPQGDPLAELVRVQLLAVELAAARGVDPDRPRNLTRSVVLDG